MLDSFHKLIGMFGYGNEDMEEVISVKVRVSTAKSKSVGEIRRSFLVDVSSYGQEARGFLQSADFSRALRCLLSSPDWRASKREVE